jgi:Arc/MetJ family transcription regulator
MKRTTISVPDDLLARAQRAADQRHVSLGEVFRDALRSYIESGGAWDPPRSLGAGDSGGAGRGRDLSDLPDEAFGPGPA